MGAGPFKLSWRGTIMSDLVIGMVITVFSILATAYITVHITHSSSKEDALNFLSKISRKLWVFIQVGLQLCALYIFGSKLISEISILEGPVEREAITNIIISVVGISITSSLIVFQICMLFIREVLSIGRDQLELSDRLRAYVNDVAQLTKSTAGNDSGL
jgi:hypothetical protein